MKRLIDTNSAVRFGIFAEPIDEVNHRDFELTTPFGRRVGALRRHFAFNQFEFLGALGEDLVFGCAIANVKYAGTAFVYAYDPRTRHFDEFSLRTPLALGFTNDQFPERGSATVQIGRRRIHMSGASRPPQRRLCVDLPGKMAIDATFSEIAPAIEPMRICTPVGASGWVYARKSAGHRVEGTLSVQGRTLDLGRLGVLGHHDWTAGYMRRDTFWNWGCVAGRLADGRVVGMNVSCGVNETSFTENCFWLDGKLHKIDSVHFDYDRRDIMRPWRLRSYDGRADLTFQPEGRHSENVNAFVVASNFNQLIGRYRGTLRTAAGEPLVIDGLLGYAERHYAKW